VNRSGNKQERLLLVVSAGIEAVRGLERLKRSGWALAVLDGDPQAPGFALADEALHVSTYDCGAAARAAIGLHQRRPISGVMSIAADVPHTVAHIARTLGLPGIETETATLAMDKLAMKERFAREGVRIPWFAAVSGPEDIEVHMRDRALVIKPVDSRGARGVLRLSAGTDLDWAFGCAQRESPSGRVMVEEFIAGAQLSTESMLVDGKAYTSGLSDRNYELLEQTAPFVIENGGDQPSDQGPDLLARVDPVIEAAAAAIGLTDGVLKGDLVLDEQGQVVVIEVAPRLSGGYFCTDQIPLSTGVDLVELQARVAVGAALDIDALTPRRWSPTCIRYFFPEGGTLRSVEGFDRMRAEPWVEHAGLFLEAGDVIPALSDHTRRAGFVLVSGATREQAQARAIRAVDAVTFTVDPPFAASVETGTDPAMAATPGAPQLPEPSQNAPTVESGPV
jgi:biotin carboxylase